MIELDTPFNPGDHDPGKLYTHVRICRQVLSEPTEGTPVLGVLLERGYLDGGTFVARMTVGPIRIRDVVASPKRPHAAASTALSKIAGRKAKPNEKVADGMRRSIYEHLAKGPFKGTVL